MWPGNDIPTFRNNPDNLRKLSALVEKLYLECQLAFSGRDAIKKHILDMLTEWRRNMKKGYDYKNVCLFCTWLYTADTLITNILIRLHNIVIMWPIMWQYIIIQNRPD